MSLPARRATVLATLLAVALSLAACAEDGGDAGAGASPSPTAGLTAAPSPTPSVIPSTAAGWAGTVLAEPLPVGAFALTDQRGERFRFPQDTDGKVTLLYFGYTHCADICPGTLAAIAVSLRGLPPEVAEQVDVVFATVDPARDTVEVVRDWVGLFSDDFTGLTGSQEQVEAALATYGFDPPQIFDLGGGEYTVGHPAGVLAFTPDGLAHLEYPFGVTVEGWQQDLTRLVEDGWEEP
jgi:protein SCO1/2